MLDFYFKSRFSVKPHKFQIYFEKDFLVKVVLFLTHPILGPLVTCLSFQIRLTFDNFFRNLLQKEVPLKLKVRY